jgi:type II restriction-modification system restriction subunit
MEAIIMKIDFESLAFGYSLEEGTGTPNWATSLGQGKDYKINDSSEINELLKGMIYSSVDLSKIKTKIGKGGMLISGDEPQSPIIIASLFTKVFINDEFINNGNYIIIATRDTSKSHFGRIRIKYGPSNIYLADKVSYSNKDFLNIAKKQLSLAEDACWFIYDISIRNQDELVLKAVFVDKNTSVKYKNSSELHDKWKKLIPQNELSFHNNIDNTSIKKNDKPHQRIFFGAPGTGKSFELNKEAEKYFGKNNYERVTFHPNYMYGNFVGAFKPFPKILRNLDGTIKKDKDGNIQETITYEYIPGVLMKLLVKALKNPNENYLLLIEEINRGNVAAVFGDVFQLLDRDGKGQSEYVIATSRELQEYLKKEFDGYNLAENVKQNLGDNYSRLYLPSNIYIWATMNSADQGVMPMDTAFRRRWEFRYLGIDDAAESNKEDFERYKFKINSSEVVNWDLFRRELNKKLSLLNIPEDKLIGPYFVSKAILEDPDLDRLTETIKNKVLMYLYEDAAKAHRPSLFAENKYATYSDVCAYFSENALNLFKGNIEIETETINKNLTCDDKIIDERPIAAEDEAEYKS